MVVVTVWNKTNHSLNVVGPEHPQNNPLVLAAGKKMTTAYSGRQWTFSYCNALLGMIHSLSKTLHNGTFEIHDDGMRLVPEGTICAHWTTMQLSNDPLPRLW